jgi:hypothetical protein
VLGLIAMFLASGDTHLLCRKARIEARSRAGYTFLWRLDFLRPMPKAARHDLLQRIARRTALPESRRFLALLQSWVEHHEAWEALEFLPVPDHVANSAAARASRDHALNEVATAFLSPPPSPLWAIVGKDFLRSTHLSEGEIARYLFLLPIMLARIASKWRRQLRSSLLDDREKRSNDGRTRFTFAFGIGSRSAAGAQSGAR